MKENRILFDIKYRQQIENGDYEVETRDGRPVRIICWDAGGDAGELVALVKQGNSEATCRYYRHGSYYSRAKNSSLDLFIITPELAESEDERIRREMIEAIRKIEPSKTYIRLSQEEKEAWIDYLERQKEPEHFELKEGHWYFCHHPYCCRAEHLTVKEGERFMCEKNGIIRGFAIKEPEKYFIECSAPAPAEDEQKEQKSAIEETLAKAGLKPYKDGNQWCILVGDNIQEGICGFGDTIDEALYQFLINVLEWQKEKKSAERSEGYVKDILSSASCWLSEYAGFILSDNKDKSSVLYTLAKRIKSLPNPHWKPSGEQMHSLSIALDRNDRIGHELYTLYNDLKKLI